MKNIAKNISELIAWLIVLFAVASCSTPEKLIDKAIKKDPTILQQYADTVTLTRIDTDSILVEIGDTIIWEKILTEVEYDTVFFYDQINIERKKRRIEIRKAAKLEKYKAKLEAKLQQQQAKYQLKIDKLTARLESKENRQEKRQESKERRSNKFWIGFFIGVLSVLLIIFAIRSIIRKLITLY